jgi:hypothetical protein
MLQTLYLIRFFTPKSPEGDFTRAWIKSPLGDLGVKIQAKLTLWNTELSSFRNPYKISPLGDGGNTRKIQFELV